MLWILAGAFVNAYFLIRGDDYAAFADDAWTSFVRDAWRSVVAPHQGIFIGLLIAFEAAAGVLVLIEGRARQAGLVMLVSFNVLLVAFSWWFLLWSVPLVLSLVSLWRAAPVTRSGHRPPSTRRNVLGSEDLPPAVVEPFCSAATPAHVANVESTR
ncbi:hypothetical protein [Aeromicrobium terrae]|uniref:Uncharacterized protein n=1 Tax=Aeromicrobium terrae TaxID=2498846 RepID=A0A5C8NDE0_9ACTN|nr:hypothetical protein [Aeromicrobium terrae]TXL57522.1 hypothetical protein FHP06_14215 [Aeromicrobium terrae]